MRRRFAIFVMLFVIIFVMASTGMPNRKALHQHLTADTLAVDTLSMDSLELAIYRHNKLIDDSLRQDSINKKKANSIEAPVVYSSNDSLVYDAENKIAYLYGGSSVDYQDMKLKSDRISIRLDSNLVRATGTPDSTADDGVIGAPVFKMGADEYKSDTIAFNFKSKKGLIRNVHTEQQDGFLYSERSKRSDDGTLYLEHGRYTTCDDPEPDFYIALSKAKVQPGKRVIFGPAYLVVADVPLPLAIPYGFFPFTKKYSSGFIMPSYGDENTRGFYLRDGGYYLAISDMWDRIYKEWLPTADYERIPDYDIENYLPGDTDSPDYVCEICLPVRKK